MKRVQMILEDWQHEWLADEARRQGVSMSALLRELLSQAIDARQSQSLNDDPLWGIIGMAEGPVDGVFSENIDTILYPPIRPSVSMIADADERKNDY